MRSTAGSAPPGSEHRAVLITNAEERSVLAACRSLADAGYRVTAASHTALAPAQWSRACAERLRVPDPRRDARGFVAGLREELARRRYAALMPGSDGALLAISRARDLLPAATATGLPAHAAVLRALSRTSLDEAARAAGFPELESVSCAGLQEALAAACELGYPVALKSADAAHAGGTPSPARRRDDSYATRPSCDARRPTSAERSCCSRSSTATRFRSPG